MPSLDGYKVAELTDPEESPAQRPDAVTKLIVVEHVYHQPAGEQPGMIPIRFSRTLKSRDRTITRHLKLTAEPVPVCDYPRDCAAVVIENRSGTNLQRIPSDQQWQKIESRVIKVTLDGQPLLDIPPTEGQRLTLSAGVLGSLQVYCEAGADCLIHLIPE